MWTIARETVIGVAAVQCTGDALTPVEARISTAGIEHCSKETSSSRTVDSVEYLDIKLGNVWCCDHTNALQAKRLDLARPLTKVLNQINGLETVVNKLL